MKISVIVPVYNVKDYLRDCIESVICQTYSNFELILINDGSTDGSADICNAYSASYPHCIKAFHVENGGALKSRLKGILYSDGDILVFLDSDDCMRNDALNQIASSFSKYECDMVLYDAGECQDFATKTVEYHIEPHQIINKKNKPNLYKKIINSEIPNSVCLKAIRKECAVFPEYFMEFTMRHGEDLLLSANFITNCEKIVYLNEGLYYYRDRPGSAIHSFNSERKESIKIVHTELEKYIDQWNIPELKPIHATRKVRGWMDQLKLLLKNKKALSKQEFQTELISMSEDPYFRSAYENMDKRSLSFKNRTLAFCVYSYIIKFLYNVY